MKGFTDRSQIWETGEPFNLFMARIHRYRPIIMAPEQPQSLVRIPLRIRGGAEDRDITFPCRNLRHLGLESRQKPPSDGSRYPGAASIDSRGRLVSIRLL